MIIEYTESYDLIGLSNGKIITLEFMPIVFFVFLMLPKGRFLYDCVDCTLGVSKSKLVYLVCSFRYFRQEF